MNKTKIIAKITNSNNTKEVLKELIHNGIDAFCIDSSVFDQEFCLDVIEKVNHLNGELKTNVAIMLETSGPKVHLNKFEGGSAFLKTDDKIRIYMDNTVGDETKLSVDYSDLVKDIKYDSMIKLSDGLVELEVLDKGENFLLCKVKVGGTVFDDGEVIVPEIDLKRNFLTAKDKDTIMFASKNKVDYIALGYVSSLEDVLDVNDLLIDIENNHLGIIAKIENEFALEEIDDIINVSDGVIIARENLGIEIPLERIPGIQKSLINKCHLAGKISIVESEIVSTDEELSKAEVSDIANAVLDGTDAVLIDYKNIYSEYPIDLLKSTEKIIKSAEEDIDYINFLDRAVRSENQDITGNIACSVAEIANRLRCKAIVAPTISGYTARKMSRFRPRCPIIAISTDSETVRSLSIYFGIYPVLIDSLKSLDDIVTRAKKIVASNMDIIENDKIIITGGYPFKAVRHTNLIEIEEL